MSMAPWAGEPEYDDGARDEAIRDETERLMRGWPQLPVEVYQELVDETGESAPHIAKMFFVIGVRMKRDGGDVMLTEVWDDLRVELEKAAERVAERKVDRR